VHSPVAVCLFGSQRATHINRSNWAGCTEHRAPCSIFMATMATCNRRGNKSLCDFASCEIR